MRKLAISSLFLACVVGAHGEAVKSVRLSGADEPRETAARTEFPLENLRFFESGTVRREMRFERRPIVAIFFETPDAWSSSWGGVYDVPA